MDGERTSDGQGSAKEYPARVGTPSSPRTMATQPRAPWLNGPADNADAYILMASYYKNQADMKGEGMYGGPSRELARAYGHLALLAQLGQCESQESFEK